MLNVFLPRSCQRGAPSGAGPTTSPRGQAGSLLSSFPARGFRSACSHLPHQRFLPTRADRGKWPRVAVSLQTPKHAQLPDSFRQASLAPTLSWGHPAKREAEAGTREGASLSRAHRPLGTVGPCARSHNSSSLYGNCFHVWKVSFWQFQN